MNSRKFDFSEPAELYSGGSWGGRPTPITYQKFKAAAEAIRYVVEELPDARRRVCVLEVNENRFNHQEIQRLYDSRNYPFPRQSGKDKDAT